MSEYKDTDDNTPLTIETPKCHFCHHFIWGNHSGVYKTCPGCEEKMEKAIEEAKKDEINENSFLSHLVLQSTKGFHSTCMKTCDFCNRHYCQDCMETCDEDDDGEKLSIDLCTVCNIHSSLKEFRCITKGRKVVKSGDMDILEDDISEVDTHLETTKTEEASGSEFIKGCVDRVYFWDTIEIVKKLQTEELVTLQKKWNVYNRWCEQNTKYIENHERYYKRT